MQKRVSSDGDDLEMAGDVRGDERDRFHAAIAERRRAPRRGTVVARPQADPSGGEGRDDFEVLRRAASLNERRGAGDSRSEIVGATPFERRGVAPEVCEAVADSRDDLEVVE